jgi:hypothetical protein
LGLRRCNCGFEYVWTFSNHQTPKISMFLILIKISLWVVRIWDFEGVIGVLNTFGHFQITKHLKLAYFGFLSKLAFKKRLDGGFINKFLFSLFVGMAPKAGNEWKDHGWWIKVDDIESSCSSNRRKSTEGANPPMAAESLGMRNTSGPRSVDRTTNSVIPGSSSGAIDTAG